MNPWEIICTIAPSTPRAAAVGSPDSMSVKAMKKPSVTNPMWETEE